MHSMLCGPEGSRRVAEVSSAFAPEYGHSVKIVELHPLNKLLEVN